MTIIENCGLLEIVINFTQQYCDVIVIVTKFNYILYTRNYTRNSQNTHLFSNVFRHWL